MNLTAAQIEDIVRVVVQRLRSGDVAAPAVEAPGKTPASKGLARPAQPEVGELPLNERVITLASLKDRLSGVQALLVHPKAVVTPAVFDELRQRSIRLVRQLPAGNTAAPRTAPLLLVASRERLTAMGQRVCSKQAQSVAAENAERERATIEQHLADGKSGAVWCSATPFACLAATYGNAQLRAVQLSDLRDLPRALEQAQPNVLVLDCRQWTTPAITNLVRNWYRSLL